ncbi:MAG: ribonuclease H-like domain-containing protein [Planctomycetes bacterium]|nr:ribonuclease H-like domain-containing protein [Planctomycetota bacterium]
MKSLRRRLREAREAASGAGAASPPPLFATRLGEAPAAGLALTLAIDRALTDEECGVAARTHGEERLLCFDLEATGLGGADAVFLAGFLTSEGERWRLIQLVAANVVEERALLIETARWFAVHDRILTYNGSSFDLPLLRRRRRYHALAEPEPAPRHTDLLHAVRRRFKKRLQDYRLGTVEREVIGMARDGGDVGGAEVPLRFLEFLATRDTRHLEPVLAHNRTDVISLARLHAALAAPEAASAPAE